MAELFDILEFKTVKATDVLDIPETWTLILTLSDTLAAGTYLLGISVQGIMPDTNDAGMLRFRVDGSPWSEYVREASDKKDTFDFAYMYPTVRDAGAVVIELEASKEQGGSQFDIQFADIWMQRVT